MQKHGPWTIVKRELKYSDPWIELNCDQVIRPDGDNGTYSTVKLKSGVCVIALKDNASVVLTEEFHYAVGRVTLEGVSGGVEDDESIDDAARRELREEIGYTAAHLYHLGVLDPFTAAIHSTVDLFLATGLQKCPRDLEGTEVIRPVEVPFDQAVEMVRTSAITHSPTCVAILRIALDRLLANQANGTDDAA